MEHAKPLPSYLVQRYRGWKAGTYEANQAWYQRLAEGQNPRAMVISCCDSRVHVTSIFGADEGEFFIHRNIANLVPKYEIDGGLHGTSAAIEYAVTALKVAHILVLGHSACGGVQGCIDKCSGNAPQLSEDTSFVGKWIDILSPSFEKVKDLTGRDQSLALEREAVVVSLNNLMTFPFVKEAVEKGRLTLHGLRNDIGTGGVEQYNPATGTFDPI